MKILVTLSVVIGISYAQQHRRLAPQYQNQEDQYDEQAQQTQARPQHFQNQDQDRPRLKSESTTFIPIIRFDKEQGSDGSYKAAYETGNNIIAQEEGFLKDLGPDPDSEGGTLNAQVQQGSYTYTSPEGQIITVNYIADEKGFHPSGDHLPTPPPVSPEVQKGLDLIFAGIRAQEEEDAREAKENPQGFKNREIPEDYNGQYRQQ
ncbi:endocuticle structural glycoprotein SgAbd-8-like [Cylas formicarius]|uniref:endocuticle structural glycoprotein SgAbd-8-like n=1 Tax=Cylas formicarius TaxID=197179 RepID=UPI002958AEC2|nr:endocuticle structural glycoprotein SgAbd-8-like [Cylas formicarius]